MTNKSIKIAVSSDVLATEYQAGATVRQLAAKYGCSFQNISIRLRNADVTMRPKHPRKYAERPCATCGVLFHPRTATQRYHTQSCVPRKDVMRLTHCKRGHPLSGDNLIPRIGTTPPRCRECSRLRQRKHDTQTRRDERLLRRCLAWFEENAAGGALIEDLKARLD